ncbi:MAG: DUF1648 domain-containing protein [Desulfitobacteriia bacterium]
MQKESPSVPVKRPVLEIPFTQIELVIEIIGAVAILVMIGFVVISWPELPDRIPSHFDAVFGK